MPDSIYKVISRVVAYRARVKVSFKYREPHGTP